MRVIAATHRDLKRLVSEGAFREDLYYRLAGYEIVVPPLRERGSDLQLLVEFFRDKVNRELGRGAAPGPSSAVLRVFEQHAWRGNVRELEQVVRRLLIDTAALTNEDAARRALLSVDPSGTSSSAEPSPLKKESPEDALLSLDDAEKQHIAQILRATAGNQTQAAYILGIERKTLARKIRKYGLAPVEATQEGDEE